MVVARQARDPDLLDQRRPQLAAGPGRTAPGQEDVSSRPRAVVVQVQDTLLPPIGPTCGRLADQDPVVYYGGAQHHEDVGGVVVRHVVWGVVPVVPVDHVAQHGVQVADVGHDEVDPAAAVDRVVAVLAFEPVRVGAAPDQIVAAAAENLVLARTAVDFIRRAARVSKGVLSISRT